MIAVDSNILVYAHRRDSPHHAAAAACVASLAESRPAWAVPWQCLHEFLGVVTHPRIFAPPSTPAEAFEQVEAWLASRSLTLLGEGREHWATLRSTMEGGGALGPRVHDARIAAICIQHGVRELWTADRDFSRFPGIVVRNPLTPAPRPPA